MGVNGRHSETSFFNCRKQGESLVERIDECFWVLGGPSAIRKHFPFKLTHYTASFSIDNDSIGQWVQNRLQRQAIDRLSNRVYPHGTGRFWFVRV